LARSSSLELYIKKCSNMKVGSSRRNLFTIYSHVTSLVEIIYCTFGIIYAFEAVNRCVILAVLEGVKYLCPDSHRD
jgi:hypothetical protein